MGFYRIYIYRPDWAWNKNIPRDCLYDLKGNSIDHPVEAPKEPERDLPFGRKDYQIEVDR